ncbi:MAG TPA: dihydroorotate dehydrogenase electron transfer subunit [Planctomycetota bacterium]|nr:dihydroorotate dehydrogenase electron transfer subunit [Planctomycetota bacterium]
MDKNAFQVCAEVLSNAEAGQRYRRMVLLAPEVAAAAKPGQFVNLRVGGGLDPLLGRPFGVFFAEPDSGRVEILYRPTGRGTHMLGAVQSGSRLGLVGPLGRGFTIEKGVEAHVAVGGGTGLAPVYFLAAEAARSGLPVWLLFGFRDCSFGLPEDLMRRTGAHFRLSSDAGEAGCLRGTAVDLLDLVLDRELAGKRTAVYTAGPAIMMKLAAEAAARRGFPCQASLEAHMACGLSVCRGCVVAVKGTAPDGGPLRRPVCTFGPVMNAAEIDWDRYLQGG